MATSSSLLNDLISIFDTNINPPQNVQDDQDITETFSDSDNDTSKPILEFDSIINGMMRIEIVNLDEYFSIDDNEMKDYEFIISYKFTFKHPNINYQQQWNSVKFTLNSINQYNKFCLKVPLFLSSYKLQFNLIIKVLQLINNNSDTEDENDDDDASNGSNGEQWELITKTKSKTQTVQIPSISIDSEFKKGDHIQYCVKGAGYVRSGIIQELNDNSVKIKTDFGYSLSDRIVHVDIEDVLRYPTEGVFIVDITNRTKAEFDLILRSKHNEITNDKDIDLLEIYCILCDYLRDFYWLECNDSEEEMHHFGFMASEISMEIYGFLFEKQYNYRIGCMLGNDGILFYEKQWRYHVLRTLKNLRNGVKMNKVQNARDAFGYTCDICRSEISWYEIMYHCTCTHQHDFCVTCIHSMLQQYEEMKQLISKIMRNVIDDDCIGEIVSFCVGKVNKF